MDNFTAQNTINSIKKVIHENAWTKRYISTPSESWTGLYNCNNYNNMKDEEKKY